MTKLFPHMTFDTRDDSLTILSDTITLPLFRPVYVMKTERGEVWYSAMDGRL